MQNLIKITIKLLHSIVTIIEMNSPDDIFIIILKFLYRHSTHLHLKEKFFFPRILI